MTQRAKRVVIELISFPVQAVQVMRFICTCARGTEPAVVAELASLGVDSEVISRGAVSFEAELEQAYRVLRRSRTAGRLLLELGRYQVTSDDEVYEAAGTVAWEEHLDVGGSFVVDAVARGQGWNQRFVALRVKDAIADRFRERVGARPDVDREAPDLRVHVHLRDHQLDLAIDIGGGPLHRRGYRQIGSEAPLRENLAASLLWLAEWPRRAAEGQPLFDPMMGSGTLLIEGASIALGLPPENRVRRPPMAGWVIKEIRGKG